MDNQHQKITGYRDLSEEEIELMNEIKALAEKCGALTMKLENDYVNLDKRWLATGKIDLQKGFMFLVRSIAQPTTF